MKGGRRADLARRRASYWAGWLVILLCVGALAVGFVGLRNAQVRAGNGLKEAEERLAALETEIEAYEAEIAKATSRPELLERLRERAPALVPVEADRVIRLPLGGGGSEE